MSYQVLARKWRPRQFSELVGQQHVKTALANALSSSRLHHAYLFTGTRGVGKTTIARIFAKSLNCETGVTATPCGRCSACQEIDAGNFVDLMEIDAASRTKVEDTRDLLDNVQYAPSRGRFKVYLIDEVHMLSRHSFNALLKTLEEPPPHVKFLLATTDPQKLPVTVLSRCLQFSLKALTVPQIEQHLAQVLTAEQIPYESAALALLAKAAKGSLRDSLSLTDQAIALSDSHLTLEPVRQMLGLLDTSWSVQLLAALLAADINQLQQALQALLSQQSDYQQVLDDMLSLLHLTALTQLQPAAAELSEQADFIKQLAQQQSPEAIQLYYQLLLSGKKDLPFAPEPLIGLEMALLRAMAFVPTVASTAAPTPASPLRTELSSSKVMASTTNADAANSHTQPLVTPPISKINEAVSSATTSETFSESVEDIHREHTAPEQNLAPEAMPPTLTQAEPEVAVNSGIDPVTARIMQRRGVALPSVAQGTNIKEDHAKKESIAKYDLEKIDIGKESTDKKSAEKKSERPSAPLLSASAKPLPRALPEKLQPAITTEPIAATIAIEPAQKGPTSSAATDKRDTENSGGNASVNEDNGNDDNNDDSVSFAEQQALTEAWWQQQSFVPLPAADADELDEQRFSIRFAAQVDPWARLIEQLPVGGLMRLYLLHSAMQQENNTVRLTVAQSQQHLDNAEFRHKLYTAISPVFAAGFELQINYQSELSDSPLAIQQRIELERKDYVSRLLQQDPIVQAIQQRFAAQLQLDTLQVN